MALSKKQAQSIASLYNSVIVARSMKSDAVQASDAEGYQVWHKSERDASAKLFAMGIPVVGFEPDTTAQV